MHSAVLSFPIQFSFVLSDFEPISVLLAQEGIAIHIINQIAEPYMLMGTG